MYLIVTRSFPPELGGMQSLMWGLSRELSKNFMISLDLTNVVNEYQISIGEDGSHNLPTNL